MTNSIADQYAAIKIQIEALELQLKPLKTQISDEAPAIGQKTEKGWTIDGDLFRLTVSVSSRKTINESLLTEKFGLTAAQIAECKKESIFDMINYKAI